MRSFDTIGCGFALNALFAADLSVESAIFFLPSVLCQLRISPDVVSVTTAQSAPSPSASRAAASTCLSLSSAGSDEPASSAICCRAETFDDENGIFLGDTSSFSIPVLYHAGDLGSTKTAHDVTTIWLFSSAFAICLCLSDAIIPQNAEIITQTHY